MVSVDTVWKFSEDKTNIILHTLKVFLKVSHQVSVLQSKDLIFGRVISKVKKTMVL